MRLRGVFQSLQSAAERILLGRPREAMSQAPGRHAPRRGARRQPAPCRIRPEARSRLPFTLGLIIVVLSLCSGLRHLSDPHRPHPHRADASRRGGRAAHQPDARAGDDRHHRLAGDRAVARPAPAGRRRAAACPHRQPVQRHRRRAGDRACHLCQHLAQPRPRSLVLRPHQIDHPELDRRGDRLSPGARPGDPRRHRRHGQGHRRGGRAGEVAAARLRQFPHRAGRHAGRCPSPISSTATARCSPPRRRCPTSPSRRRPKRPWISPRRAR